MSVCVRETEMEVTMRWEAWWDSEGRRGRWKNWRGSEKEMEENARRMYPVTCCWSACVCVCVRVPAASNPGSALVTVVMLSSVYRSARRVKCHWTAYMCSPQSERNVKHGKTADVSRYVCVGVLYLSGQRRCVRRSPGTLPSSLYVNPLWHMAFKLFWIVSLFVLCVSLRAAADFFCIFFTSSEW